MYICICKTVTDRQIREAVAGGARTMKALRRELGVSSGCGQCTAAAKECLKAALESSGNVAKTVKAGKKERHDSRKKN